MSDDHIPLSEAAIRLGLTYHQCRALVLSGRLAGGRDVFGRLYVDAGALRERREPAASDRRPAARGRRTR